MQDIGCLDVGNKIVVKKGPGSDGKESTCNVGDLVSIPGSGRYSWEGNGYPFQYSCLENSMDIRPVGLQRVGLDWAANTNIQVRTHTSIIIATSGSREPGLPRAASFSAIPHPLMCCVGVPVPALNSSISLSAMDMHLAASHFHPKASPRQAVYKNSLSCFSADGTFYMRNNPADSILHSLNKNELACGLVGIWIRNELCCQKKSLLKMGVCELLVLSSKYWFRHKFKNLRPYTAVYLPPLSPSFSFHELKS